MDDTQTMKLPSVAQLLMEGQVLPLLLCLAVPLTFPKTLNKLYVHMKMPSEGKEGRR